MEIDFFGGNCVRVKTKQTVLVFDDNLDKIGGKNVVKEGAVLLYSASHLHSEKAAVRARLVLDSPGEYEVGDISVTAVAARSHMDGDNESTAVVYQCLFDGGVVTVMGHVHPDISPDVLEMIAGSDVLVVPVGGNGFTLDPVGAASVIKKVEPDVVIPTQYDSEGLTYEVPAVPLEEFMKVSGMTPGEPLDTFKLGKTEVEGAGQTKLVVLSVKKA